MVYTLTKHLNLKKLYKPIKWVSFKGSNAEQTRGLERDTSNRVTIT